MHTAIDYIRWTQRNVSLVVHMSRLYLMNARTHPIDSMASLQNPSMRNRKLLNLIDITKWNRRPRSRDQDQSKQKQPLFLACLSSERTSSYYGRHRRYRIQRRVHTVLAHRTEQNTCITLTALPTLLNWKTSSGPIQSHYAKSSIIYIPAGAKYVRAFLLRHRQKLVRTP